MKQRILIFLMNVAAATTALAQSDSLQLQEVLVTGTRAATDVPTCL